MQTHRILIVGAGYSGAVAARELADHGFQVLVIDRREHIAGNAYDEGDAAGILVHRYGPHIFHTNSERVFRYLSRFTAWRAYEHRVLAHVAGKLLPIPINRTTINELYGLNLDEAGVAAYLESVRVPCEHPQTSEDVVLNSVGHDLCEKFFRGYTRKQWGLDLSELAAGVAARIPTRCNDDDRYFTDVYQAMPLEGYTQMFERMLDHPSIETRLGVDYFNATDLGDFDHTIFTGPIDAFFGYCLGRLPYRSLRFEHEHLAGVERYQPTGTINYPNDHAYTRITEFRHLTGQTHTGTSIVREFPQADGEPYYPIPRPQNQAHYKRYETLAAERPDVTFVGRLAEYRYYNMDQAVAAALTAARRLIERLRPGSQGEA
ncbi:UDP-galactopyranose mutase precursor [Azoarcus sp. Aa7]|nr:UDP-galactopyranose mutase precursor [Azoarcus sp. Aa7]